MAEIWLNSDFDLVAFSEEEWEIDSKSERERER